MSIEPEKLYSIKFVSEILGVSMQTLRNWDKDKSFPSNRTACKHRRYSGKSILDRINMNHVESSNLVGNNNI